MARIVPAISEWIDQAAQQITSGNLVAFPTETVYGLGANALNSDAVQKIFDAKRRPATNPLIVHIAEITMLNTICEINNKYLEILADKFWPGPLTLILNKKNTVPDIVTAGGNTVGIRMPNHPVALEIIRKSGVPIAAPSANRSEEISPTTAQHVADSLGDNVDLILDGGSCEVGIESTVLDITCDIPRILRPGQISQAQIQEVLGMKLSHLTHSPNESISRSPGQMPRHYAPKKSLKIIASSKSSTTLNIIGISSDNQSTKVFEMSYSPRFYSQQLYACLRALDSDPSVVSIEVEAPPETPEWDAIWDRLRRASTPK